MSIYMALLLFAIIILLYWGISELFTILFSFTGLPEEKARFQVMSLLTGTGFTTRESEIIIASRIRRRLARGTMLFGYVFNLTFVTAFINIFLSLKMTQVEHVFQGIYLPLMLIVLAFTAIRTPSVRAKLDKLLERLAGKVLRHNQENAVMLIDYIGEDSIAQVLVRHVPEPLQDVTLAQSGLRAKENLLVMLLEREGKKPVPPTAVTVFRDGDKLTVFGDYQTICRVFEAREYFDDF
ncbi:MAG: hypothetical protein J6A79_16220 [Clostridia bacterium]|nr:hypothetical protein [Oscillospiraceae bacterium]MBO5570457.1 hypothetical protein [Clostridia bacterium]